MRTSILVTPSCYWRLCVCQSILSFRKSIDSSLMNPKVGSAASGLLSFKLVLTVLRWGYNFWHAVENPYAASRRVIKAVFMSVQRQSAIFLSVCLCVSKCSDWIDTFHHYKMFLVPVREQTVYFLFFRSSKKRCFRLPLFARSNFCTSIPSCCNGAYPSRIQSGFVQHIVLKVWLHSG